MKRATWIAGLAAVVLCAGLAGAQEKKAASKVEAVTLYRGSALVTRTVTLPNEAGELVLVVENLPGAVQADSLNAAGGEDVKVRSVRFRQSAVPEVPSKDAAELDARIKDASARLFANQQMMKLLADKAAYLNNLEKFSADKGKDEMSKGTLNPEAIAKVSEFLFAQRTKLVEDQIKLTAEQQSISEEIDLLARKRRELSGAGGKVSREAVIFLSKVKAGAGQVSLSYVVSSANWTPGYTFRLDGDNTKVQLDYVAHVQQLSGEDWSDVKLTLSTATPRMNAEIPLLAPMWVALGPVGGAPMPNADEFSANMPPSQTGQQAQPGKGGNLYAQQRESQIAALNTWNTARPNKQSDEQVGWELNRLAADNQNLELTLGKKQLREWAAGARAIEEGLAVAYELPGTISLASRNDMQMVGILTTSLPGKSYYEVAPLLATYVFQGTDLVNTTGLPMLAGNYQAYVGQEFVGSGQLPLVAKGQNFSIGFGVDTQLRCTRELKDKTDKTELGSRVQSFAYALTVENFKDKPVTIRLIDRIPVTKNVDMAIKLTETSSELSKDTEYLSALRDKGILRWDIEVPATAIGSKAKKVEYTFEMKFASDRTAGAMPAALDAEMRREYQQMLQDKK